MGPWIVTFIICGLIFTRIARLVKLGITFLVIAVFCSLIGIGPKILVFEETEKPIKERPVVLRVIDKAKLLVQPHYPWDPPIDKF